MKDVAGLKEPSKSMSYPSELLSTTHCNKFCRTLTVIDATRESFCRALLYDFMIPVDVQCRSSRSGGLGDLLTNKQVDREDHLPLTGSARVG